MQPEARLIKKLKEYLEGRQARVIKIHGGDNPFQESGISDLLFCYKGYFGAFEAKMPENGLSLKQAFFLESIGGAGGFASAGGLRELKLLVADMNARWQAERSAPIGKRRLKE